MKKKLFFICGEYKYLRFIYHGLYNSENTAGLIRVVYRAVDDNGVPLPAVRSESLRGVGSRDNRIQFHRYVDGSWLDGLRQTPYYRSARRPVIEALRASGLHDVVERLFPETVSGVVT